MKVTFHRIITHSAFLSSLVSIPFCWRVEENDDVAERAGGIEFFPVVISTVIFTILTYKGIKSGLIHFVRLPNFIFCLPLM